jgi:galactokinase
MKIKFGFFVLVALFLNGCSSSKNSGTTNSLFEVLVTNNDGGANIKFYEILTEPKEIMMLMGDETLKKKIKKNDMDKSNFIILNAGPTKETFNRAYVQKVVETTEAIEVYVKDMQKNVEADLSNENVVYPYSIIKINSKKPIIIK